MSKRKQLLHIIPYTDWVPPKNGGALRCYHLCTELAKYFQVTLLTYQDKSTINDPQFDSVEVYNPKKSKLSTGLVSKFKNAAMYRWYQGSFKGPAEAVVLDFYPLIKQLSKTHDFDVVLMEHLSSMQLGKLLKKNFPNTFRIVDQHNIDHHLYAQHHDLKVLANQQMFKHLKHQESQMHAYADCFFACSEDDVKGLELLNNHKIQGFVVPNGTKQRQIDVANKDFYSPQLIFCGSLDYVPNKNGLLWFYEAIWPKLLKDIPDITLTVIGRNGHDEVYLRLKQDVRINFVGEVDDVAPYYLKSVIAIVPLQEGSGTRLKVLEAMSFGVPVISTSTGAEGISYTNNKNIIIADDEKSFSQSIVNLFKNPEHLNNISLHGLELVREKYDWVNIGSDVATKVLPNLKQ